jgi:hypothetical protein
MGCYPITGISLLTGDGLRAYLYHWSWLIALDKLTSDAQHWSWTDIETQGPVGSNKFVG